MSRTIETEAWGALVRPKSGHPWLWPMAFRTRRALIDYAEQNCRRNWRQQVRKCGRRAVKVRIVAEIEDKGKGEKHD